MRFLSVTLCGLLHDRHAWLVTFENLGNGQTKLTFVGNETMEDAKDNGQLESWNQVLDKLAAVLKEVAQAK